MKLDFPAVPLFLQFKRSDCLVRSSAIEIRDYGLDLSRPYYRFKVTERKKSNQHEMLLALDNGPNNVFYVAPKFHLLSEINDAWSQNNVSGRSIFIAPSEIGVLDDESHHVAFDERKAFLCSDPRPVDALSGPDLVKRLADRLAKAKAPLSEQLPYMIENLRSAKSRAIKKLAYRTGAQDHVYELGEKSEPPRVETRRARELQEEQRLLRELADEAATAFNAQLVLVQSR